MSVKNYILNIEFFIVNKMERFRFPKAILATTTFSLGNIKIKISSRTPHLPVVSGLDGRLIEFESFTPEGLELEMFGSQYLTLMGVTRTDDWEIRYNGLYLLLKSAKVILVVNLRKKTYAVRHSNLAKQ